MQDSLRNELYNTIVRCRQLLEEDYRRQLEGNFGIHTSGAIEELDHLIHLDTVGRTDRQAMEGAIRHLRAGGDSAAAAVVRFIRESAFSTLNRLVAFKLMEHPSRALIPETIGRGSHSRGFQQFSMIAPEVMRTYADGGYRYYLRLLSADLAMVMEDLFDPDLPTFVLFPSESCFQALLDLLNRQALAPVWPEDETIGWVFQYFTPKELRDQARKASSAPRSSYELSFRNQFYTPRYVVSFLADNTLGRLWWAMRQGETQLVERCRYLIRRPEPWLATEDPEQNGQERLALVAKRDPRTLRILDPAVGSAHFLLYCFEILQVIYQEAYDDPDLGPALRSEYPDPAAYQAAVPGLILAHNLHGVDIDRRACQIARLALWLRAQRALAEQDVKLHDRPLIRRIHIVCAQPMPGEYDLLGEFSRDLQPVILGKILQDLWQQMTVAGEAGTLLKIEQAMKTIVANARQKLMALPETVQLSIFSADAAPTHLRRQDLDDEAFWSNATDRIVRELHRYAGNQLYTAGGVQRRLFADDALQGVALIELLRHTYDVILMNPPFGAASLGSKAYITKIYPRTKNDLYAAFVERGLELLHPGGYLGAITSRTGFFLTSFQKWREEIILQEAQLIALADLGYGVLDTAMVETAAYILQKS